MGDDELRVREATEADLPAILAVATAALGWDPSQPNEAFFRWKHVDNPAGSSPMWVATDNDTIVGFRTMMRWAYQSPGGPLRAVRAVDTATAPSHLRRGIFRMLTLRAVDDLTDEGVDFVFNTPNEKSRPGYVRMGWVDTGRLPVRIALGPTSLLRVIRARTAADKWSTPLDAGSPIDELATELADRATAPDAVATHRTADHLRWRYGFEPLHYRVIEHGSAAAVVRLRRRGAATEAVLADVVSPSARATARLIGRIRRLPGVDHVLTLAAPPHPAPPLPPVPRLGPHLTLRPLASTPPAIDDFRFSLGDIELF